MMKIAIVGAGIAGRMLAWMLKRAPALHGCELHIFDQRDERDATSASHVAAGMLSPYSEIESAELPIFELGMRSLQLWQTIATDLGDSIEFNTRGSLLLSHPNDRADLQRFQLQLERKLGANSGFDVLGRDAVAAKEPALADRFSEALYFGQEASVNTSATLEALRTGLADASAHWHFNAPVESIAPHELHLASGKEHFDWVLDARGLMARDYFEQLRGVRGETVLLQAPDVQLEHIVRLMHPRYRLYIVPRSGSQYYLGATQIESEDDSPITVRSMLELLSAAYSVHSGFGEAHILASRAQCRPALPDNLPRIETSDGLIRLNGLFRHGYLLAPALAEQCVSWLTARDSFSPSHEELFHHAA